MGDRLTIYANSNVSRGKFAAAAVHTALRHYGIEHGAVIVLGAKPGVIEAECTSVIRDAGRTEVDPGTITAGVRRHEFDRLPGYCPCTKDGRHVADDEPKCDACGLTGEVDHA